MTRILVGVDGSELSRHALEWAMTHAHAVDGTIKVVTAAPKGALIEPTATLYWTPDEYLVEEATRLQSEVLAKVDNPGVAIEHEVITGHPTQILCDERDFDLLVVGARGLGAVSGILLGSIAQQVASHSTVPVVVVRGPHREVTRILLAVDGSAPSKRAAGLASSVATARGAELEVVTVTPWTSAPEAMAALAGMPTSEFVRIHDEAAHKRLEQAVGALQGGHRTKVAALHGTASERLVEHARSSQADLVVVGTRGRGGFRRLLLGSVSHRLLHKLEVPLLLVP